MKNLSSIEIKAIVEELQAFVDGKVDQVYQPDLTEITITFYKRDLGRQMLRIMPGVGLYISSKKRHSPKVPINFCRFLRKRLNNAILTKVVQKNMERIVEFHFLGREQNFILIAEFFSRGNIVFCDDEYKIIFALQFQTWKDRKIRAKHIYEYPPPKQVRFDEFEDFALFIEQSKQSTLVKKLAAGVNLGGLYAEEICFRAKVDKNEERLDDRALKRIYTQLNAILDEEPLPNLIKDNPVPFIMHSLGEGKRHATFSKCLDLYYQQFLKEEDLVIEEQQETKSKYAVMLDEQEKMLVRTELAIVENKVKGDWIYANYMEVQELLRLFKENKKGELVKRGVQIDGTALIVEIGE